MYIQLLPQNPNYSNLFEHYYSVDVLYSVFEEAISMVQEPLRYQISILYIMFKIQNSNEPEFFVENISVFNFKDPDFRHFFLNLDGVAIFI